MKVIALPKSASSYTEVFYRAVEDAGLSVASGVFSGGWLSRNVQRGDVVHLHWPSFLYAGPRSLAGRLVHFARFLALLGIVRLRGGTLMWTAHNVLPHDASVPAWIDVAARRIVIRMSRAIFVHGAQAAQALVERFPASAAKIRLIPHGNWIGYYPRTMERSAARSALGLSDSTFAFLFIGLCKPYKNVDGLIEAFRSLEGDCALIIAGGFQDDRYLERIRALSAADPRVRLYPGIIADENMQSYLLASDAVVAPYREVLTSGTAVLALSFGRPIVSVRKGFLLDVVTDSCGVLFDPGAPGALTQALRAARTTRFDAEAILAHARGFTFAGAAEVFSSAVHQTWAGARA